MKITSIDCVELKLKLSEPYTIAYETIDIAENVFVRIETDGNLVGFGCAAPDMEVTGENAATVVAAIREVVEPALRKSDPLRLAMLMERLRKPLEKQPSARAAVDMVNIKLMKVGGIAEALHINSVARSAGLEVMVGCMDESALAIAAGLHFALARPNVEYADLDGHLALINDPARGAVTCRNGYLFPTGRPGIGFDEIDI